MGRLIWGFASHTYHIVGNLMLRFRLCCTSQSTIFQSYRDVILGWTSTKQWGLSGYTVPLVRFKSGTPWSPVKQSTDHRAAVLLQQSCCESQRNKADSDQNFLLSIYTSSCILQTQVTHFLIDISLFSPTLKEIDSIFYTAQLVIVRRLNMSYLAFWIH